MLTSYPALDPTVPVDETWPEMLAAPLAAFMDYWTSIAAQPRDPPLRRDFDFAAIPALVPRLVVADVDAPGPGRFRFRFMGSWHLLAFGREITGMTADELDADGGDGRIAETYRRIVDTRAPHYWRRPSVFRGFCFVTYQRVMAPLVEEDGRVSALIGCFDQAEDGP